MQIVFKNASKPYGKESLQALRCCNKMLAKASNAMQGSITFSAHRLPTVSTYLRKLSSVDRITIYQSFHCEESLCDLSLITDAVSELSILLLRADHAKPMLVLNPSRTFLPWQDCLTHMVLTHCDFLGTTSEGSNPSRLCSWSPNFPNLNKLYMIACSLVSLDLRGCMNLSELHLSFNAHLSKLDMTGTDSGKGVTQDIPKHDKLKVVDLSRCKSLIASSFDGCKALESVTCRFNVSLVSLSLMKCESLNHLALYGNPRLRLVWNREKCKNLHSIQTKHQ